MDGETFGQALRRLRQERHLSLRKLQVLTRYDFTYLGQVERGEKPGSLDLASTCDRALGVGQLVQTYRRSSALKVRLTREEDDAVRRRTAIKALAATPVAVTRGFYGLAHEAATAAADDELAAALGHLAFVPAREGDTVAAVDCLTGAAAHASRAGTRILRSWVAAVESEVLTGVNPAGCMRALDQAAAMLATAGGGTTPAWFDYYSADRLDGFRGYTLLKLGRPEEARHALTTALGGIGPAAVKQRAVFLIDIASSHLAGGAPDVDHACHLAGDAAGSLATASYATARDRLRELRTRLRPWEHTQAVRDLDDRLAELTT